MELFFLLILVVLMATALGSGYPVAFALPGSSIITIMLAAGTGYLFTGDSTAYFDQGGASQWLSAGVTNLRGVYWEPERDTLIAIPLFIFMGIMLQRSKIAEDLLITMANLFGPVPGGLGISVVFVGALLAATTGIVGATVVAMGLISLPAMLRNNYSQSLATGTIAASGTLGQIIPPSIVLIILADQLASAADQGSNLRKALYKANTGDPAMPTSFDVVSTSAGEMFLGAFIPGLVLVGLYMAYILIAAWLRPNIAPPVEYTGKYDRAFAFKVVITLVPPLLLIFLVLGSIMAGIATVNQAGAIGAAGALVMSGYRLQEGKARAYWPAIISVLSIIAISLIVSNFDTNIKNIKSSSDMFGVTMAVIATIGLIIGLVWSGYRALVTENTLEGVMIETAKATSLVFIILLGAAILTAAFRAFGGEHLVREFLEGLPGGFWTKFVIVMAVIFVLGFFLDFIEIAVVVVPIVAPILLADPSANVTAVWLGVMIGLNIQTSFLTPPFGFALFYLRGVAPAVVKTINMYKGVIPYILLQILALIIVSVAPPLVNYLPNRVALLSENAPPPRNPKLNYCVDQYVSTEIATSGNAILTSVETARQIDLSALPQSMQKDISASFDSVTDAIAKLGDAEVIAASVTTASETFRPTHSHVRAIERDMRRFDDEIDEIENRMNRLDNEDRKAILQHEIDELAQERDVLAQSIPSDWEAKLKEFRDLQKQETSAYRGYSSAANKGYEPIAQMMVILEGNENFAALKPALEALQKRVGVDAPDDLVDPLKELSSEFNAVEGASDVARAISSARSALRKSTPLVDDAIEDMQNAMSEFETQMAWRTSAKEQIAPQLATYEDSLRSTIGIRNQANFTRDQALFVAGCQAHHRDISLNF
ncbi:C4-dicarboxylate ABC transporter permease [Amylibacter kogurei]|uniref:C4-dicarboxylate ABC transporter permease n=1 Tax=Paramylibacter kogurei TaxID=1889778 RepID=A0A2G5K297_9RHOB|nr:TRAP transporter large permease subunit [Amylibacter kogurei]PIB23535.1 C4-dicarboxylate ABC transporter permease [Amylibacter kogurei]